MTQKKTKEHVASAKGTNLAISTKSSVVISRFLRYKKTSLAKKLLEGVLAKTTAVPFRKFNRDLAHKRGIGPGRFPMKAAKEFLTLIKSAEANAQAKGLNTDSLKIVTILANRASTPMTGGRHRHGTKRTHIELVVQEGAAAPKRKSGTPVKKEVSSKPEQKTEPKPELKLQSTEKSTKSVEEKPAEKSVSAKENKEVADQETSTEEIQDEIADEIAEEVKEEVKGDIPTSPETKTVEEKEEAAEKIAEKVKADVEELAEEIAEENNEQKENNKQNKKSDSTKVEDAPIVEVVKEEKKEQPAAVTKELKQEEKPAKENKQKVEPAPEDRPQELSSEELLRRAQAKADELNKKEEAEKQSQAVEKLYDQLKQKGTLRNTK